MRRLCAGDKILRVRDEGEDTRAPLVFIHGAGSSSVVWMDAIRRLKGSRRVVAPDLPGHGQSDPWHEFSLELYRDAVGTVCALLRIERAILVGHSMGALVALAIAAAWPERVAGLALVSASEPILVDAPADTACLWSPETSPDLVQRWATLAWNADPEVTQADYAAIAVAARKEPMAPSVRSPTIVISGADDLVTPSAEGRELARSIANAAHVTIPGASHMLFLEQPDAFHAALEAFTTAL